MNAIYDFFFGEPLHGATRYNRRHKRDGLCVDCKRKALPGRSRCAIDLARKAKDRAKYAGARAQKNSVDAITTISPDVTKTSTDSVERWAGGTLTSYKG